MTSIFWTPSTQGEYIYRASISPNTKVVKKLINIGNVVFGPECTKETQTLAHHLS